MRLGQLGSLVFTLLHLVSAGPTDGPVLFWPPAVGDRGVAMQDDVGAQPVIGDLPDFTPGTCPRIVGFAPRLKQRSDPSVSSRRLARRRSRATRDATAASHALQPRSRGCRWLAQLNQPGQVADRQRTENFGIRSGFRYVISVVSHQPIIRVEAWIFDGVRREWDLLLMFSPDDPAQNHYSATFYFTPPEGLQWTEGRFWVNYRIPESNGHASVFEESSDFGESSDDFMASSDGDDDDDDDDEEASTLGGSSPVRQRRYGEWSGEGLEKV